MQPDIDTFDLESQLEKDLKKKFEQIWKDEAGDTTKWDKQLSYLLSTALINYEMERLANVTFSGEEFKSSIKHYVPQGHTFKAFPIQFNHLDVTKMSIALIKSRIGYEVLAAKGDMVKHALRVKVVPYPENICAVWVMIAVSFKAPL